jgi:hypothetical protein
MTLKKVTEHFSYQSLVGDRSTKGDRWVTDKKINPSPRKPLFYNSFSPKGDRVTDKIQIIGYIYNKGKIAINALKVGAKNKIQQNAFICHSVTSTAFRGFVA